MKTIGNIIWLIIAGWAIALAFAVAGVIMFIFIVTIPWGIASFRLANYALWPFGRTSVPNPDAGVASLIGNILWMIFAGHLDRPGPDRLRHRPVPDHHRHPVGHRRLQDGPAGADPAGAHHRAHVGPVGPAGGVRAARRLTRHRLPPIPSYPTNAPDDHPGAFVMFVNPR